MKNIAKIERFFNQEGWTIKYYCCQTKKHIGGKSFYNNGTYLVDNYRIRINGKEFELNVKITGRPMFWFISKEKEIIVAFSQRQLLDYLKSNRDMYGDRIY